MIFGFDAIEFLKSDSKDKITITFEVKDKKAIKEFLDNKDLQTFLTDPYDMDPTKRGCRLTVTYNEENATLSIGRQLKATTNKYAAYQDLVISTASFIIPFDWDSYAGAFADIMGPLDNDLRSFASMAKRVEENTQNWTRAKQFALKPCTEIPTVTPTSKKQADDKKEEAQEEKKSAFNYKH